MGTENIRITRKMSQSLSSLSMPPKGGVDSMLDRNGSEDSLDISNDGAALESQAYAALQSDVTNGVTEGKSSAEILMPYIFDITTTVQKPECE